METTIEQFAGLPQSRSEVTQPSPGLPDDEGLVLAARQGDRSAFGQLFRRFSPMVHGVLLARVTPQEAEDLVQDVFLAALRSLHTLRDDAAFPGWLAVIARNRARDHYRRIVETVEVSEGDAASTPSPSEADAALDAIRALPEAYRETLILRLVEGMTGDEIAARTGLRPSSVRVNLHRGMKLLRKKLGMKERP
jgi:RNA polymerase sigma-70 factor (ECF subfamily)